MSPPVEAGGAQYGCSLAPPVPAGLALCDTRGKGWVVGSKLGAGAFGAIYNATRAGEEDRPAEYVVKIEPHSNGPLFVEMHAFLRIGKEEHVADWQPKAKLKPAGWVGIPRFHGSGSVILPAVTDSDVPLKLRFVVMTKLGTDLEKFFKAGLKPFPLATVLNIGVQVINSLEYIHSKGYCHNDIKAQNLLLDSSGCDVFLVDFGLACKFQDNQGFHCDGDPDERKAHDGTREYTSRDAHTGAHSRRGDLETLAYNMVHWTTGFLPWADTMELEYVEAQKNGLMENISGFLTKCFKPSPHPVVLERFMEAVVALEFRSRPDYKALRSMLTEALEDLGSGPHQKLQFSTKTKQRRSRKSDVFAGFQPEDNLERSTRSKDDGNKVFWQDVLDPESILKSSSRSRLDSEMEVSEDPRKEAAMKEMQRESLLNPTPEMSRLLADIEKREKEREALSWKDQLAELNKRKEAMKSKWASMDLTPCHNTPHMEEVIVRRAERLAMDRATPEPSDDEMELMEKENRRSSRSRTSTPDLKPKSVSFCSPAIAPSPAMMHTPSNTKVLSKRNRTKDAAESPVEAGAHDRSSGEQVDGATTPAKSSPGRSSGQSYTPCHVCKKTLNAKSMARHLREVHGVVKRALPTTPARSGFTPDVKRGKKLAEDKIKVPHNHLPDAEALLDSPAKNLRVAPCPVCGIELAKSLLPKHFDDQHSPSGVRRGRSSKGAIKTVEEVAGSLAKVSVSSDSPEKIRNFDSPLRPTSNNGAEVGQLGQTFRRVTRSVKVNNALKKD